MKKYNLPMIFVLSTIPLVGILGTSIYTYYYGIAPLEPLLMILGWLFSGLGITFGYHRLFAHRSFKAHPAIQFFAMICGSAALQNSIIKWSSDHRLHHKKLDTKDDPYSITKGFFHAHIGWIIEDKPSTIENVDDLKNNRIVMFQHKYYWPIAIGFSFLLPMAIGGYFGRPVGGLLWGGFLRLTLVHHFTFFINSLCHYVGKKPFDENTTARDSWWVAYLTFGEGFHNFHHKFQWDYRNGIRWYHFDPSKWAIKFLSLFNLTKDIKKVHEHIILRAQFNSMRDKFYLFLPKTPQGIKRTYKKKLDELQDQASQAYSAWSKFEINFQNLKKNGFKNNSQKKSMFYKRKNFILQYKSILNTLSMLLITMKAKI